MALCMVRVFLQIPLMAPLMECTRRFPEPQPTNIMPDILPAVKLLL